MKVKETYIIAIPDSGGNLHLAKVYKITGESPNLARPAPTRYILEDSSQSKSLEVITEERFNLLSANPIT